MLRGKLLSTLVTLALAATAPAFAAPASGDVSGKDDLLAALSGSAGRLGREVPLPSLLSAADEAAYRSAFALESAGQSAAADRALAKVTDRLLVGHLLAQRFLSSAYHVRPDEMKSWLAHYADLPEADDIYAMARKKLGKNFHAAGIAAPPHGAGTPIDTDDADWSNFTIDSGQKLAAVERAKLDRVKSLFRGKVSDAKYDAAIDLLNSADAVRLLAPADVDEMKTVMAVALFEEGRDGDAVYWAEQAADRSGDVLPEANWIAGLALWRQNLRAESVRHFEAVANAPTVSNWLTSAGAFWAARANLAAHQPEVVNHWLSQAAQYPRTFYGMLARRALGLDTEFSWDDRPFTDIDAESLLRLPAAVRAIALLQVGQRSLAEDEMRSLVPAASQGLAQSLLAFARAADMPSLTVSLGRFVSTHDGRYHDAAFYPLPSWQPAGGWTVDRALVLAFARQESSFNPHAHSPAGAIGLMQVMPTTARAMGCEGPLTNPEINLQVGQRYIHHLLGDDSINGNLMLLAASYNSGPTAALRWVQSIRHNDDALLFMESIPAQETRVFVERVLTNFWAYRARLGKTSPSLDALAAGYWPLYDATKSTVASVRHAKN